MGISVFGIGKIIGVLLHFPLPVITGFRLVFKDGSIREIKFNVKPAKKGILYLFDPPIILREDMEASLQFKSIISGIEPYLDLFVEPIKPVEEIKFHIGEDHGHDEMEEA